MGKAKRAQRLENVGHYLTAFVVFLKGIDKVGTPGKGLYATIFLLIAAAIVFGTVFHHKFERHLKHFKAFVFIFEGVVMAIVGYLYMKEGKQYVQFACFMASIVFFVATVIYFRKAKTAIH